jgi:hypothetical protein
MKPAFKTVLALLVVVAFAYTACTKSQTSATNTTNTATLSKQLALGLYNSLSGKYGGANINDGIKVPASLSPYSKGPRINSVTPFCGYVIDTTYSNHTQSGDTSRVFGGHFKFTFGCSASILDSYLLSDTVTNTESSSTFNNVFSISQSYFVKALDATYKTSSVEGYINNSFHTSVLAGAVTTQYHNLDSQYGLHNVKVDISSGLADVTEGTANFYAQVANLDPTTPPDGYFGSFSGTITFIGNHTAKVSITVGNDTKAYTVNMLTGVVTEG